jgi:AmmeMemoRadiSam system protein A
MPERDAGERGAVFHSQNNQKAEEMTGANKAEFSQEARNRMISLAREAVEASIKGVRTPFEKVDQPELQERLGCFVTLKNKGNLRGCIGRFTSDEPLWKNIVEMAVAAATKDLRFMGDPITVDELKNINVEISVLSSPELVENPMRDLKLGRDGIIVETGSRRGVFLPQVARETGWNLEEFLGHCARDKAGIGWDGWKRPDAKVYGYTAVIIEESQGNQ